jgi:hypothetical protein
MSPDSTHLNVIITGATGMVGEGVLLTCLEHPAIAQVLLVSRKQYGLQHPKLKECIVPDFLHLDDVRSQLTGYDACFFCAGISSAGMSEANYTHITYDITLHFAGVLASLNPQMVFCYVSGALTDSSEKGSIMWARVKGRTENALTRLGFRSVYNFRPRLYAGHSRPAKHQVLLQADWMGLSAAPRDAAKPGQHPARCRHRHDPLRAARLSEANSGNQGHQRVRQILDILPWNQHGQRVRHHFHPHRQRAQPFSVRLDK